MTDFKRRKFEALFDRFDYDGDGYITATDFDTMATAFSSEASDVAALRNAFQRWWTLLVPADTDQSGRIDRSEFAALLAQPAMADQIYAAVARPIVDLLLGALDITGDRKVSAEEYRRLFTLGGTPDDAIAAAFRRLDHDGDGAITAAEFHQAIRELFLSEDPQAPGNWVLTNP